MKASLRKQMTSVRWLTLALSAGGTWLGVAGCSTTSTLVPQVPPKEIAVPAYAYLPHPGGYTSSDVRLLFTEKSAPSREKMAKCEGDFRSLYKKVESIEERAQGVRELVSRNPAAYHWCFYSRILELEEGLAQDDYVDEKQKRITTTYEYLVPVARAFMHEFQDSRYVRWAIRDYRRLADLYFYRKVELSPQMSSQLVDVAIPVDEKSAEIFEDSLKPSVIEKYKIGDSLAEKEPAEVVPPPVQAPSIVKTVAPTTVAKPDSQAIETIQYANELARQRKETESTNRAPAGKEAPPPAVSTFEAKESPK